MARVARTAEPHLQHRTMNIERDSRLCISISQHIIADPNLLLSVSFSPLSHKALLLLEFPAMNISLQGSASAFFLDSQIPKAVHMTRF